MKPWNPNVPTAPSRAIEREAIPAIAALLEVPSCGVEALRDAIVAGGGRTVVMHADGGWGAGAEFGPRMQMSFARSGIDYATPVYAHPAGRGKLHLVSCDGQSAWVAYWPNCGNLSRLELADPMGGPSTLGPDHGTMRVDEPGSGLALLAGMLAYWLWRALT